VFSALVFMRGFSGFAFYAVCYVVVFLPLPASVEYSSKHSVFCVQSLVFPLPVVSVGGTVRESGGLPERASIFLVHL